MEFTDILLQLFIILTMAKLSAWVARKFGQVEVLGEIIGGVIIGASVLGLVRESGSLHLLAELGAIFLLFEIGVSSNLYNFLKVGLWAFAVAVVGVFFPFLFGYFVATYFGLDTVHAIFIGAILTATSVGITGRVFSDLNKLHIKEAQIVLGAAVIDDVIGLAILAVVTKLVLTGSVSMINITYITGLAVLFLAGSLLAGAILAPLMFRLLKKREFRGL